MITATLSQPLVDKDSPANKWLNENPVVLGGILLVLGAILCTVGIRELKRGAAKDKYGNEYSGGKARLMSMMRLVGGIAAAAFGIYKLVAA